MSTINEVLHPRAFLVSHHHGLSHEQVTIGASQTIVAGQVLGRTVAAALAAIAGAANSGNTGTGAFTAATPAYDGALKEGRYLVTFTDATHFLVEDPNGRDVGEGVTGTAFAKGPHFTIAASGDFVAGDGFVIQATVERSMERYLAWDPAATDGSQEAAAIADYPVVTGSGVTAQIAATVRHAEVRQADLTFHASITTAQLDEAIEELKRRLIIMR